MDQQVIQEDRFLEWFFIRSHFISRSSTSHRSKMTPNCFTTNTSVTTLHYRDNYLFMSPSKLTSSRHNFFYRYEGTSVHDDDKIWLKPILHGAYQTANELFRSTSRQFTAESAMTINYKPHTLRPIVCTNTTFVNPSTLMLICTGIRNADLNIKTKWIARLHDADTTHKALTVNKDLSRTKTTLLIDWHTKPHPHSWPVVIVVITLVTLVTQVQPQHIDSTCIKLSCIQLHISITTLHWLYFRHHAYQPRALLSRSASSCSFYGPLPHNYLTTFSPFPDLPPKNHFIPLRFQFTGNKSRHTLKDLCCFRQSNTSNTINHL